MEYTPGRHHLMVMSFSLLVILVWSAINPHDYFTWFLEVLPAVAGFVLLAATYRNFRFTTLAYTLMWVHAVILMVGGHYTYAEVPLFNWIRDSFGFSRNHYDRVGHFAQGFVPAIISREILLRKSPLNQGKWLFFIVLCICLSISAFYELIEWFVAEATGTSAEAFLGTQGDVWDSQWDMFLALTGTVTAQLSLRTTHDKHLKSLLNKQT